MVLAQTVSARPTRELRSFLAAAGVLVADGTIEDEAGELFEAEIVEPWLNGPEALRGLLFSRLGALDPHVPDLVRGAWAQVEQGGPAATSMASHAVREATDRTLRALAPSELVLRLFAAGRLPKNSVHEKNGERHPTRPAASRPRFTSATPTPPPAESTGKTTGACTELGAAAARLDPRKDY